MKRYVVAFLFMGDNFEYVWLIKKNKPEWQKGCLNGIGGKIENGEMPIEAMMRELKEEGGIEFEPEELTYIGNMLGTNNDGSKFEVCIFTGICNQEIVSQEEEQIDLYRVDRVKEYKHIENVPMLIETAIYRLSGHSYFYQMTMDYNQALREEKSIKA